MKKKGEHFLEIIKAKELATITKDSIEAIIDINMNEGILKEIPIFSTFFNSVKFVNSIQDTLFTKKILIFLYELKGVEQDTRLSQIIKLEDDLKYRTKVGEKLLFIIDKCDDLDKASMIGKLFHAYLKEDISYDDFISCISVVTRTPLPDLFSFIQGNWNQISTEGGGSEYVSYGLMEIRISEPRIKIELDSFPIHENRYIIPEPSILEKSISISNFSITCYLTPIGELIRKHLR